MACTPRTRYGRGGACGRAMAVASGMHSGSRYRERRARRSRVLGVGVEVVRAMLSRRLRYMGYSRLLEKREGRCGRLGEEMAPWGSRP